MVPRTHTASAKDALKDAGTRKSHKTNGQIGQAGTNGQKKGLICIYWQKCFGFCKHTHTPDIEMDRL